MGFSIRGEVSGLGPVLQAMQGMKLGVRNKALRRGVTKATRLVRKAAKALAPVDTTTVGLTEKGVYKKSIDVKVSVKGDRVVGIVGPKRMKVQTGVRRRKGKKSEVGEAVYQDPSRIGHLLEFGHAGPHPAAAKPHMRPAWDANKNQASKIIADECWLEIAKWSRS